MNGGINDQLQRGVPASPHCSDKHAHRPHHPLDSGEARGLHLPACLPALGLDRSCARGPTTPDPAVRQALLAAQRARGTESMPTGCHSTDKELLCFPSYACLRLLETCQQELIFLSSKESHNDEPTNKNAAHLRALGSTREEDQSEYLVQGGCPH